MPGLMSLRTLLAKAGGVVLSVSGGLACGKVTSSNDLLVVTDSFFDLHLICYDQCLDQYNCIIWFGILCND